MTSYAHKCCALVLIFCALVVLTACADDDTTHEVPTKRGYSYIVDTIGPAVCVHRSRFSDRISCIPLR